MENTNTAEVPETLETQITLDDLDVLVTLLDGVVDGMDKNDEDRPELETLSEKLADFADKICSLSEYLTGNDWPENLPLTLRVNKSDLQ